MTPSAVCATTVYFSRSCFTGKERDTEFGNEYFGARYYSSAMGRFMSPDWSAKVEPVPYAKLDDPQSLDLYAYVRNNPVASDDPNGHGCNGWCDLHGNSNQSYSDIINQDEAQIARHAAFLGNTLVNVTTAQQHVSARDQAYLNKYYGPVAAQAKLIGVDPALPLGIGIESGFGTNGTYLRTGDVFGMTGGSTANMTQAASPTQDVQKLFDGYGKQMSGSGSDVSRFINALEGQNAAGQKVPGWKTYNSAHPKEWRAMVKGGIQQMQRDLRNYQPIPVP